MVFPIGELLFWIGWVDDWVFYGNLLKLAEKSPENFQDQKFEYNVWFSAMGNQTLQRILATKKATN